MEEIQIDWKYIKEILILIIFVQLTLTFYIRFGATEILFFFKHKLICRKVLLRQPLKAK